MTEPKFLYKFRSMAGEEGARRTHDIIAKNQLYFASPFAFNDPFDCLPRFSLEADDEQVLAYLRNIIQQKLPGIDVQERERRALAIAQNKKSGPRSDLAPEIMKDLYESLLHELGILSLSARGDHVLLWSHYADCHKGVCLRFKAGEYTEFFGAAQKIEYTEKRPLLNLFTQSVEEQVQNSFTTKAKFWKYEEEWRIFNFRKGPGTHSFPPELLDAVILGAKIDRKDEAKIRSWLGERQQEVQILRAEIHPDNFELTIKGP